jgi:hypothetical protein
MTISLDHIPGDRWWGSPWDVAELADGFCEVSRCQLVCLKIVYSKNALTNHHFPINSYNVPLEMANFDIWRVHIIFRHIPLDGLQKL